MSVSSLGPLFIAMFVLAAAPSVSVLAVSARSAALGIAQGAFTALGVVVGDIVFILLALFGLVLLVEALGDMFFLVKYLGGAYLIWLGIKLWRARRTPNTTQTPGAAQPASTSRSSFMTGLLITLADQKAILFYLVFLPAFVDVPSASYADAGIIIAIAVVAVGSVKLAYAFAAQRASILVGPPGSAAMHMAAACVMIAAGLFLFVRA